MAEKHKKLGKRDRRTYISMKRQIQRTMLDNDNEAVYDTNYENRRLKNLMS